MAQKPKRYERGPSSLYESINSDAGFYLYIIYKLDLLRNLQFQHQKLHSWIPLKVHKKKVNFFIYMGVDFICFVYEFWFFGFVNLDPNLGWG